MLPLIADGISALVMGLIHKFLPDTEQEKKDALEAAMKQELLQSNIDIAQISTNTAEASNTNLFVAGWRPFIGWVCGLSFCWQYLVAPMINFLIASTGHTPIALPHFETSEMIPVLMGMLGLGTLRTYEKVTNTR